MEPPKYYVKHHDRIASDDVMDAILRRYAELPSHFISVLMGRVPYAPNTLDRLRQRTERGELLMYDPQRKISKHRSYCLNESGNRDTTKRPHRILESMVKASTEIGIRETTDFELIPWSELIIAGVVPRETLRLLDNGKNPHLIKLSDGHLLPDGDPQRIYHKPSNTHINLLDEIDRDTEPLVTKVKRRSIEEKFEHYKEFYERKLYQSHYGFSNCLLRITTTNEANKQAMMRLYEDKFGPAKHILFTTWADWFYERSYPPADGIMFTRPYHRVGYSDYFLNRFHEMDW